MTPAARTTRLARWAILALTALVGCAATLLVIATRTARAAQPVLVPHLDAQLVGLAFIAAALSTALATLGAGYAVARVGSAAIGAIAEKPELFGRALVLVGLAEGIAIYGLIVSILILNRLG